MSTHRATFHRHALTRTAPLAVAVAAGLLFSAGACAADGSSSATSNKSDWFSTSSGWETDRKFYADNKPPVGAWNFDYKHWFNAAAEPAAWTTKASPAKPGAATWDAKTFSDNHTTTGPGSTSTYAKSEWYVAPYQATLFGTTSYYAKIQTRSQANASSPDTLANSKTRVADPWVMLSPATDPSWVIDANHMLSPDGKWTVGLNMAMFGELTDRLPTSAIGTSYLAELTPATGAQHSFVSMLEISVDGTSSHVTAADSRVHLYLNGVEKTTSQVETFLNGFYSPTGWSSNPSGFTIDSFRPDNASDLSQVFNLQAAMFLDATTVAATVYTTDWSFATAAAAPIPEPEISALLLAGLGVLAGLSRRRLGRRANA
jgi:hypothetical protein